MTEKRDAADPPDIDVEDDDEGPAEDDDAPPTRSDTTEELWAEVAIDPITVSLPGGNLGYTLRAYRPVSQLTATEAPPPEEDDLFAERERARAEEEAALAELLAEEAGGEADDEELAADEPAEEEEEEEEEPEEEPEDEEVPVFLGHRGRLLLFATPEALVSFIGSDAPHDLTQLDTWETVAKRVRPADIVPTEEDAYPLDKVVANLRDGHAEWDLSLLAAAGELARDLGWALRLEPVITALAPGSPLDDLDEGVRRAAAGGVGGLLARRRLRRIGAQQASLGWRTIIGKISAAVDWRD